METFIIEGGHTLSGTITPQGAKNEALEVIAATLLTDEPVRITNIPDILDVNNLIKLLDEIGVKVTRNSRNDYTFQADSLNLEYLNSDEYVQKCAALRGSVLLMGPLLGRFGHASVAEPGGDKIGSSALFDHAAQELQRRGVGIRIERASAQTEHVDGEPVGFDVRLPCAYLYAVREQVFGVAVVCGVL